MFSVNLKINNIVTFTTVFKLIIFHSSLKSYRSTSSTPSYSQIVKDTLLKNSLLSVKQKYIFLYLVRVPHVPQPLHNATVGVYNNDDMCTI